MCPGRELHPELPSPPPGPLMNPFPEDHMSFASAPVPPSLPPAQERLSLRPDCGSCFALCCTALGFSRTADFAVDKPAGTPCLNLSDDFSCSIHDSLRPRGFSGCTVYDCFGAGQTVSQELFAGKNWRENPGSREEMFSAFKTVRQLNEMRWHLAEAQLRTLDPDVEERTSGFGTSWSKACTVSCRTCCPWMCRTCTRG